MARSGRFRATLAHVVQALALGLVLVALGAVVWREAHGGFRLPERLRMEEVQQDIVATFAPSTVVEQDVEAPVHVAGIQPSPYLDGAGSYRRSLVTSPPATLRYRLQVPEGGVLRLSVGVAQDETQDRSAAGIRFAVRIDGRRVFARVVNPARTRHDRRWFDTRIDLNDLAGRAIDVELTTRAAEGGPLSGTAGWSKVHLVRETSEGRQPAGDDRPSLLVLLVDTLRADRLGAYGAPSDPSPTLDALGRRGLVFKQAIAQASWTMPSVATVLTGLYPRQHGVVGGSWKWGQPPGVDADADWAFLPDTVSTFAEQAQRAGITTFAVSTNSTIGPGTNLARGFETFVELPGSPPHTLWASAERVNDTFLAWLAENRGRRFLAYLHYMDVHGPYAPPARFRPTPPPNIRGAIAKGMVHQPKAVIRQGGRPLPDAEVDHLSRLYDGDVRYWDEQLARLLGGLQDLGVLASTNILVTADHGEEFQEHGRLGHGSQLYDELIRVPLVLAGPSVRRGTVDAQVEGIDVAPTVLALLGLAPPRDLPGRNLLGELDSRAAVSETRFGVGPERSNVELLSVRTPDRKLIHAPALGTFELYDLVRDPAERNNRYGDDAESRALTAELERWRSAIPPPSPAPERDPRLFEKLRALGYVE